MSSTCARKLSIPRRIYNRLTPVLNYVRGATGFSAPDRLTWIERKLAVSGIRLAIFAAEYDPRLFESGPSVDDSDWLYCTLTDLADAISEPGAACGRKAEAYDRFAWHASKWASEFGMHHIVAGDDLPGTWHGNPARIRRELAELPRCHHAGSHRCTAMAAH